MDNLLQAEHDLHNSAEEMLANSSLMAVLSKLGKPIITGSYQTGLMAYPDIDFCLQSSSTTYKSLVAIIPKLQLDLQPTAIKIADFSKDPGLSAICYLGLDFDYGGLSWHISATITKPGPVGTNPPELENWLKVMTEDDRLIILKLKKELLGSRRYGSSHSKPPYTFRSVQLYEAVLVGKAKTIKQLEQYFT